MRPRGHFTHLKVVCSRRLRRSGSNLRRDNRQTVREGPQGPLADARGRHGHVRIRRQHGRRHHRPRRPRQ